MKNLNVLEEIETVLATKLNSEIGYDHNYEIMKIIKEVCNMYSFDLNDAQETMLNILQLQETKILNGENSLSDNHSSIYCAIIVSSIEALMKLGVDPETTLLEYIKG